MSDPVAGVTSMSDQSQIPVPDEDPTQPTPPGDDEQEEAGSTRFPWNDHIFRLMVTNHIGGILRVLVPPEVAKLVDLDKIEPLALQLTKPNLSFRHTDALYEAPLLDGSGNVIFLLEQQSTPVQTMGERIDEYVTLIQRAYRHRFGRKDAPPVYPIVLYRSRENRRWDGPNEVKVSPEFAAVAGKPLDRSGYVLANLEKISEDQIRTRTDDPAAQLTLVVLKMVPGNTDIDRDLKPWLGQWMEHRNRPGGEVETDWIFAYIRNKSETPADRVRALLAPLGPQVEEEFVSTISMARDEGIAEGRAEGEAKGRAAALMEVLAAKFRPVPEDVAEAVRAATGDQLGAWLRAAATANTFDEVFGRSGTPDTVGRADPMPRKGRAGFLPARWVRRWRRSS